MVVVVVATVARGSRKRIPRFGAPNLVPLTPDTLNLVPKYLSLRL